MDMPTTLSGGDLDRAGRRAGPDPAPGAGERRHADPGLTDLGGGVDVVGPGGEREVDRSHVRGHLDLGRLAVEREADAAAGGDGVHGRRAEGPALERAAAGLELDRPGEPDD